MPGPSVWFFTDIFLHVYVFRKQAAKHTTFPTPTGGFGLLG